MRVASVVAVAVAVVSVTAAGQVRSTGPVATSSVQGRVTVVESDTLVPVRRARVTVTSAAGPAGSWTVDTDTDGRYQVEGVTVGPVRVLVEKPGFVMPGRSTERARGPGAELAAGAPATLDITMLRGAALAGTIYNERGSPVEGVLVAVVRIGFTPNGRHPVVVKETVTNGAGQYRLHTLPAGDYYVRAASNALSPYTLPQAPGDAPRAVAPTYYPGAPQAEQARSLSIYYGQELSSLDITLDSVPIARVDGRVFDSTGAAPPNFTVRMQAVGGPVNEVRGFLSPRDSSYFFQAVPPGEYWFTAVVPASAARGREVVVQRLSVAGVDLAHVDLHTAPGRPVSGQVVVADGTVPVPAGLRVISHQTSFELPTPRDTAPVEPPAVDADGMFSFSELFGPRLLRVNGLPQDWALAAVILGTADITDTPVDFQQAASGPVRLVITKSTGSVRGTVRDASGQPAPGIRVVAFDPAWIRWGPLSRSLRSIETGPDGSFTIEGLLPGSYEVVPGFALEDGPWHEPWHDPTVLPRLATGAPHTVVAGGTVTVDLTIGGR